MSAIKHYWEKVALQRFGEVTEETLEMAKPIVQAQTERATMCPYIRKRLSFYDEIEERCELGGLCTPDECPDGRDIKEEEEN